MVEKSKFSTQGGHQFALEWAQVSLRGLSVKKPYQLSRTSAGSYSSFIKTQMYNSIWNVYLLILETSQSC